MAQPEFDFPNKDVTYEVIKVLSQIEVGDHICYYQFPYYRHAIVIGNDIKTQELHLIRWSLSKKEIVQCDKAFLVGRSHSLYRYIYPKGCFDSELVVKRARSRIGEKDYHVIHNFARAFPRWCKIGRGGLTHDDRSAKDKYIQGTNE